MATALLTRFLSRTTPRTTTRLIFSSSPSSFPQNSDEDPAKIIAIRDYNEEQPRRIHQIAHPLQTGGPEEAIINLVSPIGWYLRLCMPGVAEDGFKAWVDKDSNTLFYKGYGEIEDDSETSGRNYGGNIEFEPSLFKVEEIQPKMRHGILRILVLGQHQPGSKYYRG
ncbi:uncharacterized protein LOC113781502 [Coffea eugenioides]|uniref:uncharacterized protein LOC113781502 n=1 Tax=Coffea eugenioides TaxID=49369 RepID=UPI000F6111D6|nr:uncharacterized protein LOC113781502 [Coffea eugenioides]